MAKPLVAVVGRPNVGKSTLFNKVVGKRIAIVEDTPGVTRDRIYGDATWLEYNFALVDTGGIEPARDDVISVQMRRQAELAIETADVIVFLVDGREGITAADAEVAEMLRRSRKPVVLGVNKMCIRDRCPPCHKILKTSGKTNAESAHHEFSIRSEYRGKGNHC